MAAPEPLSRELHPVLEARDLAVTPPGAMEPVVRGVWFTVAAGEWVALVGENGGGKTSLLHALAGLWPVSAGTLTLDGRPFGPGVREPAAALAAVLQDPSSQILQPTVTEELAFSARNLGFPEEWVAREVDRRAMELGLEEDLSRNPATLSAGRQQQVLLAAALVGRPRLLFADEPTAHLDEPSRERVRALIRREVDRGMAVVWATQDASETRCATRTFEVGPSPLWKSVEPAGEAPDPPAAPVSQLVRIAVASPGSETGPRVRVSKPLEIGIDGGGVTAVVGPNGAGKSVLLASVAGLAQLAQVRVTWSGPHDPPIMTLQYPELQVFEELVADEVMFAAIARGKGRSQALEDAVNHLGHLGLDKNSMLARRTWTLSTGEKRLMELIGALIAPASLVILDEPTAGLDAGRREALATLVKRRAVAGPVLVASQDPAWLAMVGGRRFQLAG